jgi:hypothetical protein
MMHNMHPAGESGAAIQRSHNVTPFLYHFCLAKDGQKALYKMIF